VGGVIGGGVVTSEPATIVMTTIMLSGIFIESQSRRRSTRW
jgi:hypothetical protein